MTGRLAIRFYRIGCQEGLTSAELTNQGDFRGGATYSGIAGQKLKTGVINAIVVVVQIEQRH